MVVIFHPPANVSLRVKPLLIEVKPYSLIRLWIEENRPRIVAAAALAHHHGWEYRIVAAPNSMADQNRLAAWVEQMGCSFVDAGLPLRGHIVESLRVWKGLPTDIVFRRLRSIGIRDNEIIDTLNPLVFEGVLEPTRDAYRNQVLNLSRIPRQQACLGDVS